MTRNTDSPSPRVRITDLARDLRLPAWPLLDYFVQVNTSAWTPLPPGRIEVADGDWHTYPDGVEHWHSIGPPYLLAGWVQVAPSDLAEIARTRLPLRADWLLSRSGTALSIESAEGLLLTLDSLFVDAAAAGDLRTALAERAAQRERAAPPKRAARGADSAPPPDIISENQAV